MLKMLFLIVLMLFPSICAILLHESSNEKSSSHHLPSVRPRATAPSFKAKAVLNDGFIDIQLQDYRGLKWVVLLFYPYDYTFVCPTEIISFSDRFNDFDAINATVLAISTDSHHTHLAWTRMSRENGGVGKLNIPLLADTSKRISNDYGVLITDEEDDMFGGGPFSLAFIV